MSEQSAEAPISPFVLVGDASLVCEGDACLLPTGGSSPDSAQVPPPEDAQGHE